MSTFPVIDPVLWVRWLAAFALVVWLPGHLLIGRWMRGVDAPSRIVVSGATGLSMVPLVGLVFDAIGIAMVPLTYVPVVLALAWVLARAHAHRTLIESVTATLGAFDRPSVLIVSASVVLGAVLAVLGLHDLVAPPHVHDASNHAYLVLRVAETESVDARAVFADEAGTPAVHYLLGWHTAAALVARTASIAPYLSAWSMALTALVVLPLSLTLLWRVLGLPGPAIAFGAVLVAVNQLVPSGVHGWGGFGLLIGFVLVPVLALAWRAVQMRPGVRSAALLGCGGAALVHVHASEVAVLLLLGVLVLTSRDRAHRPGLRRARWWAWCIVLGTFVLACGPQVWELAREYTASPSIEGPPSRLQLADALDRWWESPGKTVVAKTLVLVGIVLGLRRSRTRRIAVAALVLGAFYVALAVLADPVSRWLAMPFYREPARVLYLQVFVLPPLLALPVFALRDRWRTRGPWVTSGVLALVVLLAAPGVVRNYRNMQSASPFGPDAHWIAQQVPRVVAPTDVVANGWDDGSTWAMHVAGRRFLQPCSWELFDEDGSLRPRVTGFLQRPWPAATLRLRDRGVSHLWVSDSRWRGDGDMITRASVDADPRFEAILRGTDVTLYEIQWDRDVADVPVLDQSPR